MIDPTTALLDLLTPVLAHAHLELVDVVCTSLGTPCAAVQVLVDQAPDHPLGGRIDLDGVSAATRIVDEMLEAHDPIDGSYTLEVSSPGLERPLRTPAHFRRFVGTRVTVKTVPSADGERRIEGLLADADADTDGAITVDTRRIPYAHVERARTVFVWGPQPKPGGSKKSGPGATRNNKSNDEPNNTSNKTSRTNNNKQAVGSPAADQLPGGTR